MHRAQVLDTAKGYVTRDRQVDHGRLCECGCGFPTKPYKNTIPRLGHVKGEPARYLAGHSSRTFGVSRYVVMESGCWEWQGAKDEDGYGIGWWGGRKTPAHRASWLASGRELASGVPLDHLCRNKPCVNPDHLEPVTTAENTRRGSNTKLTMEQASIIKASSESGVLIAQRYGVSPNTVYDIRHGRIWRDV